MSRGKPHRSTKHGIKILYEILGIFNKGDANSFAFNSSSKDKTWEQLADSPLKEYARKSLKDIELNFIKIV